MCNAWNHRKDCQCNFRGGHPSSHPPRPSIWTAKSYSSYLRENYRTCEKCGAKVFFVRFASGGGGFFDHIRRPWKRHWCLIVEEVYRPVTKKGVPRLKSIKSTYERDGWTPIFDIKVKRDMIEMIITASSLDIPNRLTFFTIEEPRIDVEAPTYFRKVPDVLGGVEIHYFDEIEEIQKSLFAKLL